MSRKPISEKERRDQAEQKAAEKRARNEVKRQERERAAAERAQTIYQAMWEQFSSDIEDKGKSCAYGRLLKNLTKFATPLVPHYYTAKEHQAAIVEAAEFSKGDGRQSSEDPRQLISSWLRGEDDLSRIPLEKTVAA